MVIAWTLVFVLLGPENRGSHFEDAKVAFEEGAGKEDGRRYVDGEMEKRPAGDRADDLEMYGSKMQLDHVETK